MTSPRVFRRDHVTITRIHNRNSQDISPHMAQSTPPATTAAHPIHLPAILAVMAATSRDVRVEVCDMDRAEFGKVGSSLLCHCMACVTRATGTRLPCFVTSVSTATVTSQALHPIWVPTTAWRVVCLS